MLHSLTSVECLYTEWDVLSSGPAGLQLYRMLLFIGLMSPIREEDTSGAVRHCGPVPNQSLGRHHHRARLRPNGAESERTFKLSNGESASVQADHCRSRKCNGRTEEETTHQCASSSFCTRQKHKLFGDHFAFALVFIISNISCSSSLSFLVCLLS